MATVFRLIKPEKAAAKNVWVLYSTIEKQVSKNRETWNTNLYENAFDNSSQELNISFNHLLP